MGHTVAYTLPLTCSTDGHTDDQDRRWSFNAPPVPDPCVSLTKKHAPKHSCKRNCTGRSCILQVTERLLEVWSGVLRVRTNRTLGPVWDLQTQPRCPAVRATLQGIPLHLQTAHIAGLRVPLGEKKRANLAGSPLVQQITFCASYIHKEHGSAFFVQRSLLSRHDLPPPWEAPPLQAS